MNKPLKILLAGAICSALVVGAGFINTYRLESKVRQLEADCVEEGKRNKEAQQDKIDFELLCDAKELTNLGSESTPSVGIQARVVAAQHDVWNSEDWPYTLAIVVLAISAVPWAWYFLLRRIRELRDAIAGK